MERIHSLTDASLARELSQLERVTEILTGAGPDADEQPTTASAIELPRRSPRGRTGGEPPLAA